MLSPDWLLMLAAAADVVPNPPDWPALPWIGASGWLSVIVWFGWMFGRGKILPKSTVDQMLGLKDQVIRVKDETIRIAETNAEQSRAQNSSLLEAAKVTQDLLRAISARLDRGIGGDQ